MTEIELRNKVAENVRFGVDNWGVANTVEIIMQAAKEYSQSQSPSVNDPSVLIKALEKIALGTQGMDAESGFSRYAVEKAKTALAQYNTQSPSSIEESGLKEGEKTKDPFGKGLTNYL